MARSSFKNGPRSSKTTSTATKSPLASTSRRRSRMSPWEIVPEWESSLAPSRRAGVRPRPGFCPPPFSPPAPVPTAIYPQANRPQAPHSGPTACPRSGRICLACPLSPPLPTRPEFLSPPPSSPLPPPPAPPRGGGEGVGKPRRERGRGEGGRANEKNRGPRFGQTKTALNGETSPWGPRPFRVRGNGRELAPLFNVFVFLNFFFPQRGFCLKFFFLK